MQGRRCWLRRPAPGRPRRSASAHTATRASRPSRRARRRARARRRSRPGCTRLHLSWALLVISRPRRCRLLALPRIRLAACAPPVSASPKARRPRPPHLLPAAQAGAQCHCRRRRHHHHHHLRIGAAASPLAPCQCRFPLLLPHRLRHRHTRRCASARNLQRLLRPQRLCPSRSTSARTRTAAAWTTCLTTSVLITAAASPPRARARRAVDARAATRRPRSQMPAPQPWSGR